jgi:hypothetical protein
MLGRYLNGIGFNREQGKNFFQLFEFLLNCSRNSISIFHTTLETRFMNRKDLQFLADLRIKEFYHGEKKYTVRWELQFLNFRKINVISFF